MYKKINTYIYIYIYNKWKEIIIVIRILNYKIKAFLKRCLQLYFKRVNVPTVTKARWQSIPYCWSSMEKGLITKRLPCHLRDYKQCFRISPQAKQPFKQGLLQANLAV